VLFIHSLEYARKRPLLNRLLTRDAQPVLATQSEIWGRKQAVASDVAEAIAACMWDGVGRR
jgi:hypothetical protein